MTRLPASWRLTALAVTLTAALTACSNNATTSGAPAAESTQTSAPAKATGTVTLVVHDSFGLPDEVKAAFEKESGLTLKIVTSGDGGQLANQLVLTKDAPLGDAFYGVDNSFVAQVVDSGVVQAYTPATTSPKAKTYGSDTTGIATPIDYGTVCVNIDSAWFAKEGKTPPATYDDLTSATYKDLTVVLDPTSSSTGAAFMLGTVSAFGADGFADYWKKLVANGVKIDTGWSDAYYTDFSGGGKDGKRPIVVSYGSSPASTLTKDGKSTTTATLLDTCSTQVEYAGVLTGAKNPEGAKLVVDFLASKEFQTTIPTNMYMYPVAEGISVPQEWSTFAPEPTTTHDVDPADIAKYRTTWLDQWSEAVG